MDIFKKAFEATPEYKAKEEAWAIVKETPEYKNNLEAVKAEDEAWDAVLATPACKAFEEVKKDYYKAW